MSLVIREAKAEDAGAVYKLIRGLAEYERLIDGMEADEQRIRESLFGPDPRAFALIAEWEGAAAGFALWFYNYSTFLGRYGIFLEDLFVVPEMRGKGIGKALFTALARRCVREDLGRLDWVVLDWNEPSIGFYRSLGAASKDEWTTFRLSGAALETLGNSAE